MVIFFRKVFPYQKIFDFFTTKEEFYQIGEKYYCGTGVEKNLLTAFENYQKAADKGHSAAQYKLGNMYYYGEGIEKNYKKALEWYRKAAVQGKWYC